MSKSSNDCITLLDNFEEIKNKIKKAETDSENKIYYEPKKKPGISNLLNLYSIFTKKKINQLEEELKNQNYSQFKEKVISVLEKQLAEIQEKYSFLKTEIEKILQENNKIMKEKAKKQIYFIKKNLNIFTESD